MGEWVCGLMEGEVGAGGELGRKGGEGCVASERGRCWDMVSLMAV